MLILERLSVKNIAIGLLLINSMRCIYASEDIKKNGNILTLKQNLTDNLVKDITDKETAKENVSLDNTNIPIKDPENDKILTLNRNEKNKKIKDTSQYEEDEINAKNYGDDINYDFDNWTYNGDEVKDSTIVAKYKDLSSQLQRNNTQISHKIHLSTNINVPKLMKLSSIRRQSLTSHFSNPVTIGNNNTLKKCDEYLSGDVEILPIITIQSDGLQVLDSIAQLMAFNDVYSINNFGTSPYIYCASSASVLGLSVAMDLQKSKDIKANLTKIGDKLLKNIPNKTSDNHQKKCCCSCNLFKLLWLHTFGCCIDYDEEPIIDSMYSRIPTSTLDSIINNSLQLNNSVNVPNLVIKDATANGNIIEQVKDANSSQNSKAIRNQIKLFTEPFVSVLKTFVSSDNGIIENGVNIIASNIKSYDLVKITSKDTINFMNKKNLYDSTIERVAIILDSDVDNNSKVQNDTNNLAIDLKEMEFDGVNDKLRTVKISLYTANSLINPDYSLENKYNNWKEILNNSDELKRVISNLPNINEQNNSNDSLDIEEKAENSDK